MRLFMIICDHFRRLLTIFRPFAAQFLQIQLLQGDAEQNLDLNRDFDAFSDFSGKMTDDFEFFLVFSINISRLTWEIIIKK